MFDLVGERYRCRRQPVGARTSRRTRRGTLHRRPAFQHAASVFEALGASRDLHDAQAEIAAPGALPGTGEYRRLSGRRGRCARPQARRSGDGARSAVARAGRRTAREGVGADAVVVYAKTQGDEPRVIAAVGIDADGARAVARLAIRRGGAVTVADRIIVEQLGREQDGPRAVALSVSRPLGHLRRRRRLRMMAAVARQGFELNGMREQPVQAADPTSERPLEPLLPGFLCASAAVNKVVEQIQRLQGNDLTVLITG